MDAYLAKRIRDNSDNEHLSEYIISSLDFFMDKNIDMYNSLCNSLIELIDNYGLKFVTENKTSYFSSENNTIGINRSNISNINCIVIVHELAHAIHWMYMNFSTPDNYESERKSRVQKPDFRNVLRDIMKIIVQMKHYIHKKLVDRHPINLSVECRNLIVYDSIQKLENEKYIIDDKTHIYKKIDENKYINVINKYGKEAFEFLSEIERLNKKFEEVIDNIRLGINEKPDQMFFVLSSIEGMMDSLLMGSLLEGYHNDCLYVRGVGHKKSYFDQDSRLSFMELFADYTVIKAYNNPLILKMTRNAIGDEIYTLLEETWEGIMRRNTNIGERSSSYA